MAFHSMAVAVPEERAWERVIAYTRDSCIGGREPVLGLEVTVPSTEAGVKDTVWRVTCLEPQRRLRLEASSVRSTVTMEWTVRPAGPGACEVSLDMGVSEQMTRFALAKVLEPLDPRIAARGLEIPGPLLAIAVAFLAIFVTGLILAGLQIWLRVRAQGL